MLEMGFPLHGPRKYQAEAERFTSVLQDRWRLAQWAPAPPSLRKETLRVWRGSDDSQST